MRGAKPLGVKAVAAELSLTPKTLRRWTRVGCPHHRAEGRNGALTFDAAEVRAWMKKVGRSPGAGRRPDVFRDLAAEAPVAERPAPSGRQAGQPAARDDLAGGELSAEDLVALRSIGLSEDVIAAANLPAHLIKRMSATARTRKELADADKKELENQARKGDMVARELVDRFWARQVSVVHAAFLAFPGRMAPKLHGLAYEEMYSLLEVELRRVLDQFAADLAL